MTPKPDSSTSAKPLLSWQQRAAYKVSTNRRKRQKQLSQQMTALYAIIGATVVLGLIVIVINWQNAGAARAVSCEQFPQYCVPMAGGATNTAYSAFESTDARALDAEPEAVAGVVRGMTSDNVPFIGDPDAPIQFRAVANYACSHCNTYHTNDLEPFIDEFVLTGQASLDYVLVTTTAAPQYAEIAAQAAFCAGEQGAFWEMSDELFRLGRAYGAGGFTLGQIGESASNMSLNRGALESCVSSGRYIPLLLDHQRFMQDYGVSGTPALLYRYSDDEDWTRLDGAFRGYDNMAEMTRRANGTSE